MSCNMDFVSTNYHVNKREKLIQIFAVINEFSLQWKHSEAALWTSGVSLYAWII
jgi:hypothetical protein